MATKKSKQRWNFTAELEREVKRYLKVYTWLNEDDFRSIVNDCSWDEDEKVRVDDVDFNKILRDLANEKCSISSTADENPNCCGLAEINFGSLSNMLRTNPRLNIRAQLSILLSGLYCGANLTNAYPKKPTTWPGLAGRLNKIVEPCYLGVNPNSGNHVYSWRISSFDVQNQMMTHEKRVAAAKKLLPKEAEVVVSQGKGAPTLYIVTYKGQSHNSSRDELVAIRVFLKFYNSLTFAIEHP